VSSEAFNSTHSLTFIDCWMRTSRVFTIFEVAGTETAFEGIGVIVLGVGRGWSPLCSLRSNYRMAQKVSHCQFFKKSY